MGGAAAVDDAAPDFEDPDRAQAWQKLTSLQQRMVGLIAAVEGQLRLSHSPEPTQPPTAPSGTQQEAADTDITTAKVMQQDSQLQVANRLHALDMSEGHGGQGGSGGPGGSQEDEQAAAAKALTAACQDSAAQEGDQAAADSLTLRVQEHEQVCVQIGIFSACPAGIVASKRCCRDKVVRAHVCNWGSECITWHTISHGALNMCNVI